MKPIGYVLFGQDNGGSFFQNAPRGVLCEDCQACIDLRYAPSDLKIDTFYDLSHTLDNRLICSRRAKDFFLERFDVLISEVGAWRGNSLYHVSPKISVPFSAIRRGTRFLDRCDTCGTYKSIVGAAPAYLELESLDKECFFKTDIVFGSYAEKAPLNVIGEETQKNFTGLGFSGGVFKDVFSYMGLLQLPADRQ